MSEEFTPITEQSQLDKLIAERLKRDREVQSKKYEGWISPEEQVKATADIQRQVDELNALHTQDLDVIKGLNDKVKSFETSALKTKISMELGLPYGMSSRITGETEEEIRKDAQSLKDLIGTSKPQAPQATTEPRLTQSPEKAMQNAAYRQLLGSIKKD